MDDFLKSFKNLVDIFVFRSSKILFVPYNILLRFIKASLFHKITPKNNTQMTTLYTNLLLYIAFTMNYYIRQE